MPRNPDTGRIIPDYSGYPEDVQRILTDADEIEGELRAPIEHMKECSTEQAVGLRGQGREGVRLTKLQKGFGLARKAWKLQKAELEDARGAVDLRPVFLMELVAMYPEIGKLIEASGGEGPIDENGSRWHFHHSGLEGPDVTPGNWIPELFEWGYPQVDELPGSDEGDQEEYIAGLEAFEGHLAGAIVEGIESNKRNAATAEAGRKVLAENPPKK